MGRNYLNISNVNDEYRGRVKQDIKFKTGKFVWRIAFNIPLNPSTVNNANLAVYKDDSSILATVITYNTDTNTIEIEPIEPYAEGRTYRLRITTNVKSKGGQKLKKPIDVEFSM